MSKRILLVSPSRNYPLGNEQYPSGALLLLGTILKEQGHVVKVVHMVADKRTPEGIAGEVSVFHPDIVGFTVTAYQTKMTKVLSKMIKEYDSEIITVAGGAHPSGMKGDFLVSFPDIDISVCGEGEQAMSDIVEDVPLSQIKGLCYRDGGKVVSNEPAPLWHDLDSLPIIDTRLVNFKRYSGLFPVGRRPCMFVMASRGCPYNCSFCSKSIFGNTLRLRSPENIIEEVGKLYTDWGVREIHFADDTFNANLQWAHQLLGLIIDKGYHKKMVFRVALRVNQRIVQVELLKHLKEAGVWFIYYGVENGNQAMLDRMHKGITVEEVKRVFRMTHSVGLKTEAFFIVGMPGETIQTIQDSYNLYKEIKPWWGGFSKAMPFPGTEFTKEVKARGHLLCENYDNFNPSDMVVRTDELTAEELDKWTGTLNNMTRKSKILRPKQMMYLALDQARSIIAEKQWTKPGGSI